VNSTQRKRTRFGDMSGQACNIRRSPIPGQTHDVIEGGVVHREPEVTGEALHRPAKKGREAQGAIRGRAKRCRESDDPVVVMKFRPVKARKGLEDKTGMRSSQVLIRQNLSKAILSAKGGSLFEGFQNGVQEVKASTNCSTEWGSCPVVKVEAGSAGVDRSRKYRGKANAHCLKRLEDASFLGKNQALATRNPQRKRRRRDA